MSARFPSVFVVLAAKHPPRLLADFSAKYLGWPLPNWPDTPDYFCGFRIECSCGQGALQVSGLTRDGVTITDPITVSCKSCGVARLLFDLTRHGYDAEHGHEYFGLPATGSSKRWICNQCGNDAFFVEPSFTYQYESLEDFDGIEESRIPDFFDTFCITMECSQCGEVSEADAWECA